MDPIREDYVRIFDTTLRDGEQSPGATMTSLEKLEVARGLARLGVDIMEAGFPAASPDDLAAVRSIAEEVGNTEFEVLGHKRVPTICGLARAVERDIEKAWKAVSPAKNPRIHTFLATSPIHREHKLRMSKDEVLKRIDEMVRLAVSLCNDVEFSPEDAGRTEEDFLWNAVEVAVAAGATTINIPDTVGYTTPNEFGAKIKNLIANVPGIENAVVSVHCHNDLGMATANTLSAIQNGARQAEVTINGIGERAGNTALEEVVMALQTRKPMFGLETGIDSRQITRASRLVSSATGMSVQPNKAVVGANAFAHESGIHQDGMLKNEETYEIMRPEAVGLTQTKLVLGKHSGRHAVKNRLQELGYALSDEDLGEVFQEFKRLADRKKHVTDADILALVASEVRQAPEVYALDGLQFSSGTSGMATATVRLRGPDGALHTEASLGSGPVDACFKAIDSVVQEKAVLLEYAVHAVTEGIDALGEVTVRVRREEPGKGRANPQTDTAKPRVFHGHGADTDVLVASAKAYLSALNRMFASDGAAASFDSMAPQPPKAEESSSTPDLATGATPGARG